MLAVIATWETDIEFVGPSSSRMPGAGPHRGKEEVARLFSGRGIGGRVFYSRPPSWWSRARDVTVPFVHVWRMREGKVHRGQAFTDTAALSEALGG